MINANELRIGSWIDQGPKYGPQQLSGFNIAQYEALQNGSVVAEYYQDWTPIPLSPEILDKAGFRSTVTPGVFTFRGRYFIQHTQASGWRVWLAGSGELLTYIDFAHQLQNLVFALTGEELKINL